MRLGQTGTVPDQPVCYALGLRTRFRGISERQGMVWRGPAGWAEWSPFLDYQGSELVSWLRAAEEAAECGWPPPLRTDICVNSTIPAVGPQEAYEIALAAGCQTAKVKVAERGQPLTQDAGRLETSVGIRAGLALAAALPDLPYACGLNTVALLTDDLAKEPLIAVDGMISVSDLVVDQAALDKHRPSADTVRFWQARLVRTRELAGG